MEHCADPAAFARANYVKMIATSSQMEDDASR
jgi:hypothetical protein